VLARDVAVVEFSMHQIANFVLPAAMHCQSAPKFAPRIASRANVTLVTQSALTIPRGAIRCASRLPRLARRKGVWAGRAMHSPSRPQPWAAVRWSSLGKAAPEQSASRRPPSPCGQRW
jgi:hypothetical protein